MKYISFVCVESILIFIAFGFSTGCKGAVNSNDSEDVGGRSDTPVPDSGDDTGAGDTSTGTGVPEDTETDTVNRTDVDSETAADGGMDAGADTDSDWHPDTGSDSVTTDDDTNTTADTERGSDSETGDFPDSDLDGGLDGAVVDAGDWVRIQDLVVEDNPNSVLSCYVSWYTDVPTTSTVEFGDGAFEFRIHDDALVTEHRVLIIGMHAETEYRLRAVSANGTDFDRASRRATYTTGSLPEIIPDFIPGAFEPSLMQSGWTLFNVSDASVAPPPPAVFVMVDELGLPVWYFVHGDTPDDRGDIDSRLLDSGHFLFGATRQETPKEVDLAGNVIWTGPEQIGREILHHHFDKLSDGNYVDLRHVRLEEMVGEDVVAITGDRAEIITPEHDVVMDWNFFDYFPVNLDGRADWTHANSVTVDLANDVFYVSARNMEALLKISLLGNREILWQFGEDLDFAPDPTADYPFFLHQHDPELQSDGTILIYDNGLASRPFSRVVQYAIDEVDMTSEIIWEFPGDFPDLDPWYHEEWFTRIWGDADRLENGNTLVTAGTRHEEQQSRIFEVTSEGQVVWELLLPRKGGLAMGVYRAQRLVPPLVERI